MKAQKGKLKLILYKKKGYPIFEETFNASFKTSFWNNEIKINKVYFEDKSYSLNDFKNLFYQNSKLTFEILEISLIL